jgi:xanthine dehydrogenase accessory factor
LEGDALRKAQMVIFQEKSMLVTYDTTDDDDAKSGVGLGCNGIIHVLIEPIDPLAAQHPISLLKTGLASRSGKVLVTLFDLNNKRSTQIGTCLLFTQAEDLNLFQGKDLSEPLINDVKPEVLEVFHSQKSCIAVFSGTSPIQAFIEYLEAPISLIIVGAGNDTMPLAQLSGILGWEITLVDGRANHATPERFPLAGEIHIGKPDQVLPSLKLDGRTAVVLMTHNFNYDLAIMKGILPIKIAYLGVLGPKKKLEKMIENLENEGRDLSKEDLGKIFGPMGLNIGAEAPEEIALSVISEIQTVISGEKGGFLKDKSGPIHEGEKKILAGKDK